MYKVTLCCDWFESLCGFCSSWETWYTVDFDGPLFLLFIYLKSPFRLFGKILLLKFFLLVSNSCSFVYSFQPLLSLNMYKVSMVISTVHSSELHHTRSFHSIQWPVHSFIYEFGYSYGLGPLYSLYKPILAYVLLSQSP